VKPIFVVSVVVLVSPVGTVVVVQLEQCASTDISHWSYIFRIIA